MVNHMPEESIKYKLKYYYIILFLVLWEIYEDFRGK